MDQISWLSAARIVLSLVASLDILLHKRRPVSATLWLGVVWSFPWVGVLGYVAFGIERVRWLGLADENAGAVTTALRARIPGTAGAELPATKETPGGHIFRVTEPAVTPFAVTPGIRAELLVDGDALYPALLEAIESARSSIHVQFYIIARDPTGQRLREALKKRASEGISVRLLYDRFGSAGAHLSGFFRSLRRVGIEVRPSQTWGHINLRNHRKVVVIDGRLGFVTGLNIDERNVSERGREPADRDYAVRLEGPAVRDLQLQFLFDWANAKRAPVEPLVTDELFPPPESPGRGLVQVVPGGPGDAGAGLAKAYFGAIASAAESVTVVTPYFLADDAILEALRFAALRGVRVQLVLPRKSNHWYTAYAARSLYTPLLRAGVAIFERDPPFMHAKALVVDEVYAMLGSANLDYRSLHLNFELNIEVVDEGFLAQITAQVAEEIAISRQVLLDVHEGRPLYSRLTENLCRLFQPVL